MEITIFDLERKFVKPFLSPQFSLFHPLQHNILKCTDWMERRRKTFSRKFAYITLNLINFIYNSTEHSCLSCTSFMWYAYKVTCMPYIAKAYQFNLDL